MKTEMNGALLVTLAAFTGRFDQVGPLLLDRGPPTGVLRHERVEAVIVEVVEHLPPPVG